MTGPKRMRPESAEADSELAISYVVEPERRMSDLSVESAGSAVATGRRSARGNWHSRPRIGIMGGTFDPIHNGHLVAASEVSWVYDLDEVIFVPTGRPVFKLDKNVTNAEDRYLMTSSPPRPIRNSPYHAWTSTVRESPIPSTRCETSVRNIPTRNSSSSPELTRSRKSCNGKTPTKCGIWPTSWP